MQLKQKLLFKETENLDNVFRVGEAVSHSLPLSWC